ncbi:ABC-F family ATP-binding cassette domain-containing protein [Citricoccus nitrophenolicus]|uniref:ABC-F family ATP-binding cassette domain-containing protein n=1 Tax=Citricoccus nitrophenolicus TaxID=863575 RepID=UPI0039B41894
MTHPHSASLAPEAPVLGAAAHLRVDGVSKSYASAPDHRVLTDVSLTVTTGERACLIGENGSGKSTLLRIIAGLDEEHGGAVTAPGTVGLFHQQPPFPLDWTVDRVLASATAPLRAVAAEVARLAEALTTEDLATAYDHALSEATRLGAWDVDRQVERVVDGLDLAHVPRDRPAARLSGGQLSRLSLAWLLLRRPDTLLLDEPTNHLDARGTALLVDLVTGWSGPVLIASHDRAFLDEVATTLLDLDPAPRPLAGDSDGLTRFGGRYSEYLLHRIDERERWDRRYRDEQAELKRLRQQVAANHTVGHADRPPRTEGKMAQRFYADRNAKVVSRRVNDATTALERLEQAQVSRPPAVLRFTGLDAAVRPAVRPAGGPPGHREAAPARGSGRPASGPLLVATGVTVRDRLAPVSLHLGPRLRLLVTGPNGAGKTTLLRILAGDLRPDAGSVTTPGPVTVGLLGQDTDHLPGTASGTESGAQPGTGATVEEVYRAAVGPGAAERVPLGTFGLLAERDHRRPARELSVGQRRRLDLAVLLADPPDVLLLDEPTNHFSLLLATQLEASIRDYPGAVVVASHDRWLSAGWRGDRFELRGSREGSG